jgi:hypothetical protein
MEVEVSAETDMEDALERMELDSAELVYRERRMLSSQGIKHCLVRQSQKPSI